MSFEINPSSQEFLKVLKHSCTYKVNNNNNLEVFTCPINANRFDYDRMVESLLESLSDFSISRRSKEKYEGRPMSLAKKVKERFKHYKKNKGELGEFLLYCFLESHLNAPKILSKLELKTSTEMYVNGSDGVHFLKLPNNNYQLIFGESKVYTDLTRGFRDAFKSVHDFINEENSAGDKKSGINYEKSLISSHIFNEVWSPEEEKFIEQLIYPTNSDDVVVDDAFGIFVGFELDITEKMKRLSNEEFRNEIDIKVNQIVKDRISNIDSYIEENELYGYNFHVYIMPFTDIDESRELILGSLLK